MSQPEPITGTFDFFEDSRQALVKADMPFLLVTSQDGSSATWSSANLKSLEAVEWFRKQTNIYLDHLAEGFE